jgi:DNA-binding Lrp family transcriptional regulator
MTNKIIKFPPRENKKTMSIKEVAQVLEISRRTIQDNVKKLFPNLVKNGVKTLLNEEQITILKKQIEKNTIGDRYDLADVREVALNSKTTFEISRNIEKLADEILTEQDENKLFAIAMMRMSNRISKMQNENSSLKEQNTRIEKELQYQTLSKEKYKDLAWIEAKRGEELEGYLDKRTDRQKRRAKYVYMQD